MSGSSADEDTSSSREGVDDAAFITPGRDADITVPSLGSGTGTLSEEEEADAYSSPAAGSPPVQGASKASEVNPPSVNEAKGGEFNQRDEQSSRAGEIVPNLPITSRAPLGQRTLASREQIQSTIAIVENLRQQLDETISTVDAMKRQIDQSGSDVNEMKGMLQSLIALQQGAAASDTSSTPTSSTQPSIPTTSSLSQTVTSRESSSNNSPSSTGARTATVGSTELTVIDSKIEYFILLYCIMIYPFKFFQRYCLTADSSMSALDVFEQDARAQTAAHASSSSSASSSPAPRPITTGTMAVDMPPADAGASAGVGVHSASGELTDAARDELIEEIDMKRRRLKVCRGRGVLFFSCR